MQKHTKPLSQVRSRWIAIGITILIAYLSLIKTNSFPVIEVSNIDKGYHFIAYFMLAFYWMRSLKSPKNNNKVAIACILFGVLMEILQAKITVYRSGEFLDFIANTFGVITAFFVFRWVFSKKKVN